MRLAFDLEYLYCLVGGACRQSAAVIVKTGIVLEGAVEVRPDTSYNIILQDGTYDHVIVTRIRYHLGSSLDAEEGG